MKKSLLFSLVLCLISGAVFGQKWSVNVGLVGSMPEENNFDFDKSIRATAKLGWRFGATYSLNTIDRNKPSIEVNFFKTGFRAANLLLDYPSDFDGYNMSQNNAEIALIWSKKVKLNKQNQLFLEFGFANGISFNQKVVFFNQKKKLSSLQNHGVEAVYFAPIVGFSYSKIKNMAWFFRAASSTNTNVLFHQYLKNIIYGNDMVLGFFTLQTGFRFTFPQKKADD
jgi:hypothetical protein